MKMKIKCKQCGKKFKEADKIECLIPDCKQLFPCSENVLDYKNYILSEGTVLEEFNTPEPFSSYSEADLWEGWALSAELYEQAKTDKDGDYIPY